MTAVDQAIAAIRQLVNDLGVDEVARLSGVPISTLYEAKRRDFVGPSVTTLRKLAEAAEKRQANDSERDAAA